MGLAKLYLLNGCWMVALEAYPSNSVAYALTRISIDEKTSEFPTGINPKSPWIWKFSHGNIEAIKLLLSRSDYLIYET
jgi:hypothetical protein